MFYVSKLKGTHATRLSNVLLRHVCPVVRSHGPRKLENNSSDVVLELKAPHKNGKPSFMLCTLLLLYPFRPHKGSR